MIVQVDEGGAAHDERLHVAEAGQVGGLEAVGEVGGDAGLAVGDEQIGQGGERVDRPLGRPVQAVVEAARGDERRHAQRDADDDQHHAGGSLGDVAEAQGALQG